MGKRRLDSRVFASAKGRQSRQPCGRWPESGPVSATETRARRRARTDHDDEFLPAAGWAHEARPTSVRSRCRTLLISSSSRDLMPSLAIVQTLRLRGRHWCVATSDPGRSQFHSWTPGPGLDGRLPATRLPRFAPWSRRV